MKMNIFAKCILQFTKQAQAKGLLGRLDCGHNIQPLVLFLKVVQVKYWPLFSSPSLNWQYSVQKDQWLTLPGAARVILNIYYILKPTQASDYF